MSTVGENVVFDFNVEYANDHALVYLRDESRILDAKSGKIKYRNSLNTEKCVLLSKQPDLVVESQFRSEELFLPTAFSIFRVDNKELSYTHHLEPTVIANFTKPIFNTTKSFIPVVFDDIVKSDVLTTTAIAIASIVFIIILVIFVVKCGGCKRRPVVQGQDLFP